MSANHDDFGLGEWLVQPSLNRLSCTGRVQQVEPKMMDVLAFLARHGGEVVSKQAIADAVWPDLFITESVITRAIAGLRRALCDDARSPRFIETIPKRGYRLLAAVTAVAGEVAAATPPRDLLRAAAPANPYVAGQWVRGPGFYGRSRHIAEILDGQRNGVWLLGARCVGKTSLLRQLEHLAVSETQRGEVPVFWDLQGAEETAELSRSFTDAVLDAAPQLEAAGLAAQELAGDDLFQSVAALRRGLRARGRRLLLLCDETEELIHLGGRDPSLLRKLRRALQSADGVRTVLASSVRLWELARQRDDTSPFLHGFVPPLHIGPLDDHEAEALIRQSNLAAADRPAVDDAAVAVLQQRCGNHPYLLQLACRRLLEHQDLDRTLAEVAADPSVALFFSVDLDLLEDRERTVLRLLAGSPMQDESTLAENLRLEPAAVAGSLNLLEALGFVCRDGQGSLALRCPVFRDWLGQADRTAATPT